MRSKITLLSLALLLTLGFGADLYAQTGTGTADGGYAETDDNDTDLGWLGLLGLAGLLGLKRRDTRQDVHTRTATTTPR